MDANEMYEAVLAHHGIKGMKWGRRRYQNPDGSLTPAGKKRYDDSTTTSEKVGEKKTAYDSAKKAFESARIEKRAKYAAYAKTIGDANKIQNLFGERGKTYDREIVKTIEASNRADDKYKEAKRAYKDAKKEYKQEKNKTNEGYVGKQNFAEKYIFNRATQQRINSYLNKGDSLKSARTKTYVEAGINTTAIALGIIGAEKLISKALG